MISGIIIDKIRRNTGQREAILGYLRATKVHPTADDIYDEVRKAVPNISKGTVYRNLKVLQETGQVKEMSIHGETGRYEAACDEHYHFRCNSCGCICDIDEPVHDELGKKIARRTGLKITSHLMEFRGLCLDCQRKTISTTGNI